MSVESLQVVWRHEVNKLRRSIPKEKKEHLLKLSEKLPRFTVMINGDIETIIPKTEETLKDDIGKFKLLSKVLLEALANSHHVTAN